MRVVFNVVAVVCLAVGLGGILWSGDWRLLLSFPVAFGLGMARNMPRSLHLNPGVDTATSMLGVSISKVELAMRAFVAFTLGDLVGAVVVRFTKDPNALIWTKAMWIAGLVMLPWAWRWTTAQERVESVGAMAIMLPCAVLIIALPKLTDLWIILSAVAMAAVPIVAHKRLTRKGVAA